MTMQRRSANGQGSLYEATVHGCGKDAGKWRCDNTASTLCPNAKTEWRAAKTVESYVTADGKRRTIRAVGNGPTRAIALERLDTNYKKKLVHRGELPPTELRTSARELRYTVEDFLTQWLDAKRITDTTRANYEAKLRHHILPHIGDTAIRLVTIEQARTLIRVTLPNKTKANGDRLLGDTAIRSVYFILKDAFNDAVTVGRIAVNPFLSVDTPERTQRPDENIARLKSWVPFHLIGKIHNSDDEALWLTAFFGLRMSERLGLTDDCFTWGRKPTIVVKQQLQRRIAKHGCGEWDKFNHRWPCARRHCPQKVGQVGLYIAPHTKTKASTRTIPMVEPLFSAMREHKRRQEILRKSDTFDPLPNMESLMFTDAVGRPLQHQYHLKSWHELLASTSVPDGRGHLARHYCVSLLEEMGVSPDNIVRIVGWSDASQMKTYSHQTPEIIRDPLTDFGTRLASRIKNDDHDQTQ